MRGAMVRRVDDLGRLCLPVEMRKSLGLDTGSPVTITPTEDGLILRRYILECPLCRSTVDHPCQMKRIGAALLCLACAARHEAR
jgi:AbrB family looped-hinge helix DNA binding protein